MSTKKKVILLIDDSDETLDILEICLYKKYDVITAQNGFDGLNKALKYMPDLIITDIMMPFMDGIKFFNRLRKNKDMANIPVIAVTSFVKKMSTKSLINIGFKDVLSKPINMDSILDTVTNILSPQS
ncbi:MAG: response regulator [Chitinispirillia bacterium]|jgi:DNA-binding response OmpR family regulator